MHQATYMLHPEIHNKPEEWRSSYVYNWQEHQDASGTLQDLRDAVSAGKAFMPVRMNGHHKVSAAFDFADLAAVDIDSGLTIEEFKQHPLASCACWCYTSPSHGKKPGDRFRVIFRTPERIENPELYKDLVTELILSLGGDKACTDVCRYFNGNTEADHFHWKPEAVLPQSIIEDASARARVRIARQRCDVHHQDEASIDMAIWCLHHVISPTADGERDRFIDITKSCRAGGERMFPAWSDWASSCHHGKGAKSNQTTEKFFYGFRGTSFGTLFWRANQENPDWRRDLPPELKPERESSWGIINDSVVGYEHEAFMGEPDDAIEIIREAESQTQSLFDSERPWTYRQPAQAQAVAEEGVFDELDDTGADVESFGSEPTEEQQQPRRRGRPSNETDVTSEILGRIRTIYPGIRLNAMNQQLEWGDKADPKPIDDASTLYVRISAGTNKVYNKTHTHDTALVAARENSYHPVREYLNHCNANVKPIDYFDSIATTLLGVDSGGPDADLLNPTMPSGLKLADEIMKRTMIGAVDRVMNPGCTHDWMTILIGPQNCGKTTFWSYLTPPSINNPGTYPWVAPVQQGVAFLRDRPHVLHGGWIMVFDECERFFKRRFVEDMKNLISTPVDRSARKYENERTFSRAFIVVGCANSDELFVDPTGNRRFMPIRVEGIVPSERDPSIKLIDLDRVKRDRDALWSAAYKAYLDKPEHTFSSFEIRKLNEYMLSFTGDSPLEHEALKFLARTYSGTLERENHKCHGKRYWLMADIFRGLSIDIKDERVMVRPISDILKRRGFYKERIKLKGRAMNMWFNDDKQFNTPTGNLSPNWD
ncbi:MAG TPA: hypothetical protein DEA92_08125 [Pseudomonas sp.]|jgi:hypothetical protein|nr:hypothetical protein [Pseudomonas sp.]|tara:strand:+ start:11 stop:2485 length:2475 start_codon:yes stop_codon:yes gene_type:complete